MSLVQNIDVRGPSMDTSRSLDSLTVTQSINMGQFSFPSNGFGAHPTVGATWLSSLDGGKADLLYGDTGVFGGVSAAQSWLSLSLGRSPPFNAAQANVAQIVAQGGITPGVTLLSARTNTTSDPTEFSSSIQTQYVSDLARRPTAIHGRWRNPIGSGNKIEKFTQFNSNSHRRTTNRLLPNGNGSFMQDMLDGSNLNEFDMESVAGTAYTAFNYPGGIISLEVLVPGTGYVPAAGTISLNVVSGSGNFGEISGSLVGEGTTMNGTGGYLTVSTQFGEAGSCYAVGTIVTIAGGDGTFRAKVTKVLPANLPTPGAIIMDGTIPFSSGDYQPNSTFGVQGDFGSNSRNALTTQNLVLANGEPPTKISTPIPGFPVPFGGFDTVNGTIVLPNNGVNATFLNDGPVGAAQFPNASTVNQNLTTPYGSHRRTRLAFADPKGINMSRTLNVQQSNSGSRTVNEIDTDFANTGNSGIGARG